MNLFKRLAALLLAAVLIIGLFPVGASAAEQERIEFITTYVNPRYADIFSEEDIPPFCGHRVQTYATPKYVTTMEEASVVLRQQMKDRIQPAVVYMYLDHFDSEEAVKALGREIINQALMHTGDPVEGDYLAWQHGDGTIGISGKHNSEAGGYNFTFTYDLPYYTTAAEELQVDNAVSKILSDLNLSGKTDYKKVKAIYDYICENVTYDHEHVGNESYVHQFTAYAALMDGTAVCQGYALLLYRLALELGIDSRFIAGIGNGGPHGWNIIELDNLYYNADATWDAGATNYSWFLKSPANFPDHARFEEYNTSAFHSDYPMASADYVPPSEPETPDGILINKENFPDDNFRAYLLDQDYGADAVLTDEEIAVITRIDVSEMSIASLEGIEYFTELTNLFCYGNLLTSLDVSHNTKLVEFFCQENQIAALDISKNTALQYTSFDNNALTSLIIGTQPKLLQIACSFNNLTELDVSKASALKFLGCAYNQLTTLDVSKNTALKELECSNNQLTSLDLSKNTALTQLYCSGNAYTIDLDENNQFDLTTLPGSFDASKASNWTGASVSGNILTAEGETITYSYDLGNGETKIFTLKCKLSNVHSHQYKQTVTNPTCTEQGFTTYTCSCGYSTTDDYVDALGHDYAEDVVEPTCTEGGYTTFTCSRCADTYVGAETEATGHHHEAVVTPPTCLEDGYTTYTCVCGDTYVDDETEALDHDYATKVVAPTCTAQGYTTYICIRCSDSYTADYVDPTDHSYTKTVKEPTCTEGGYTAFVCACGDTDIRDEVDPLGHTEVTDAAKAPTCTETGLTEGKRCSVCEEVLENQEVIPALGHTEVKDDAVAPTCTETGLTEGKHCSVCEHVLTKQEVVPALGHSWDEGTVIKEPTKEENGIRRYTCTVCEDTMEETIAKLGAISRIYGAKRDDTALAVADQMKAALGVEKFDSIIIAVGDNERFPDALSGSYLAAEKGAPILIYCWNRLSAATKDYIQNNLSEDGTIYILGGPPAVPTEVEEELLAQGYKVVRLSGTDRYLTNLAILNEVGVGDKEILVATGTDYPDSLSASATGLPILIVNGKGSKLKEEQKEFFANLKGNKVTILGSEAAVSAAIEEAIEEIIGTEVNRIAGSEREETSKLIAEAYYPEADFAVIAYSRNFPDGLCGGPLAYAMNAPLLVSKINRESITNAYIAANEIETGYILGSSEVVSDAVARNVFGLSENTVIPEL